MTAVLPQSGFQFSGVAARSRQQNLGDEQTSFFSLRIIATVKTLTLPFPPSFYGDDKGIEMEITMVRFSANLGTWVQVAAFALMRYLLAFAQGAREGLDIEARYHALSRKSRRDLEKLDLTRGQIAQAAIKGIPADVSLRKSADVNFGSSTFVLSSLRPPNGESRSHRGARIVEKA